nr:MAG TPA: Minor structural protein [Caudoviricetes sp.]
MYQSTKAFDNLIQQDSRTFRCLITCDDVSIENIKRVKFTGGSEGEDDFSLGSTVSQYVTITMSCAGAIEGKEFLLQIGMDIDSVEEYVPIGYFTAGKPSKNEEQIEFTAYDRMMQTERPFSIDGTTTDTISILKKIEKITKVPVVTSGLSSIPMSVPKGYSCREVLSYIAQMYAGFAVCNRQGQIEIHTYEDNKYTIGTGRYWDNFEHNDYLFTVDKLTCYTGQDKDGNSISISSGSGARTISFSNPFMTQGILDSAFQELKSFSYMPGTLKMLGDPRLDVWDIITVEDLGGESYKVPIMKLEWEYDGGLTYSIEAAGLSEDETNDSYKGPQTKEMERYYAQLVMIDTAMINKLDVDTAKITYATIKNLDVVKENVQEINGELGNFKNLTADKFTAIDAKITNLDVDHEKVGILEGEYANLKNVLMGNAGVGDLQNIHLTSDNAVIDSALIRTAVMQTVSISDLLAGDISTNKFRILSDDGGILIQGATQQWKDADGIIRMQAGRDANGDFTFALFDKTGKGILLDSTGIKEGAIADGLIVNKMVSDDAAISANKLDIDSLFTTINNSVQTINSSRIWFDEKNQTLNQVYTQMSEDVQSAKNEASNASQKMTSIETGLEGIRATLSETTSEVKEISDKTLIYNTQCTDNGDETTTISAVLYKAGKDITREYPEKNYSWRKKTESGQEFLGYGYEITVNNEDYMFGGTVVGRFTTYEQLILILNGKALILGEKAICFAKE